MNPAKRLLAGGAAVGVGIGYWLAKRTPPAVPPVPAEAQSVDPRPVPDPVVDPAKKHTGSRISWIQWAGNAVLVLVVAGFGYFAGQQASQDDRAIQEAQIRELTSIGVRLKEVDGSIGAVEAGVSDVAVAVNAQPDASAPTDEPNTEDSGDRTGVAADTGVDEPGADGNDAGVLLGLLLLGLFLSALGGKKKEPKNEKSKAKSRPKK